MALPIPLHHHCPRDISIYSTQSSVNFGTEKLNESLLDLFGQILHPECQHFTVSHCFCFLHSTCSVCGSLSTAVCYAHSNMTTNTCSIRWQHCEQVSLEQPSQNFSDQESTLKLPAQFPGCKRSQTNQGQSAYNRTQKVPLARAPSRVC